MPTRKGSYIGEVIANTRTYDTEGNKVPRWWRWDGARWDEYIRYP